MILGCPAAALAREELLPLPQSRWSSSSTRTCNADYFASAIRNNLRRTPLANPALSA